MKKITELYSLIRLNGTSFAADTFTIRGTIYMNMIWLATWFNFSIYIFIILLLQRGGNPWFIVPVVVIHIVFAAIYYMVKRGLFKIARHLLMFVTYGMIAYGDHLFGRYAYNNIFYFVFLPTALNLFSFKTERTFIFFYMLLIPVLIVIPELFTYDVFPVSQWALDMQDDVRILNMVSGFLLCLFYTGFMIFNSGKKQNKLIVQSSALQATLDNALGAIWTIDKDYMVVAVNKPFAKFAEKEFGVPDIKPGFNLMTVLRKKEVPEVLRQHYVKALNGESLTDEVKFRNEIYEVRAEPVLDENKNIVGATFTSRNVTHIRKAQEQLLKAKQDAEEASLARTRFLSNMSHELRTPLNGIIGLTNIVLSEEHLESQTKNFELMSSLSDHMMLLINNILDFTKMEAGKSSLDITRFNLRDLVKKLSLLFENSAKAKGIGFDVVVNGGADIYVKADVTKINQVLINLLANAIKFTNMGGVKLVVTVNDDTETTTSHVLFRVEDTGIGIHKDNLDKIFESFTQADAKTTRKFGGTGLGLTIADSILRMMGSSLHVESELNKGSSFWFELRMPKSSPARSKETIKKIDDFETFENIRILLAEDNHVNQLVAKNMLQKWKADIVIVSDGRKALDAARQDNFNLILMDLDMPEMDGYEATAAIRTFNASIPVVALTAASFDNMKAVLMQKGFSEVLQKPFVPKDLHAIIKSFANR